MSSGFQIRSYWEQRLAEDYSLTGVGFRRLGPSFNRWAYHVRRERFLAAVRRQGVDLPSASVLDIGTGTGFYISLWEEAGAGNIAGLDLTETAVRSLQMSYPAHRFVRADISDELNDIELEAGGFDLVSAMDIMFHIVDDDAFARALRNIRTLLRPRGILLWSDCLVPGSARRSVHRVFRSLDTVTRALDETGFHIIERRPLFVVMNDPVAAQNLVYKAAWYSMAGLVSLSDRLGEVVGRRLYPLELKLTDRLAKTPTTELLVCRRD